jgi:myo-inositol-1(or 4)-monophosphatase
MDAAQRGALELMQRWGSFSVHEKSPKDLVTDADYASQQAIFDCLRQAFPDHLFVGEETGEGLVSLNQETLDKGAPCWIVDPLDGTLNYVHRLQTFCVSIGLHHQGHLQVGVILDPVAKEMFVATRGNGAYRLELGAATSTAIRIRSSQCKRLAESMIACSFPPNVRRDAIEVKQFSAVLEQGQSLRRLGSCALNLCYVAAGRLDGYWTQNVYAWDMAAGALIAEEAGATITSLAGTPLDILQPTFCVAGTAELHRALLQCIASA